MKVLPVIHILNKDQVEEQVSLVVSSGADGFWLINHDTNNSDQITLEFAEKYIAQYPELIIGVNLLSLEPDQAIDEVLKTQIKYLWLDYAGIHSVMPDASLLERQKYVIEQHNLTIFGGTAFKYQAIEPDPVAAAKLSQRYGIICTTSGSRTGHAADYEKISSMSNAVSGKLALASGLTLDNLPDYQPHLEYALVATGLSLDYYHFDPVLLSGFIEKNKEIKQVKSD